MADIGAAVKEREDHLIAYCSIECPCKVEIETTNSTDFASEDSPVFREESSIRKLRPPLSY